MKKFIKNILSYPLILIANLYRKLICPISIMDPLTTLKYIKDKHICVSRFGDGEISLLFKEHSIVFQQQSKDLADKLLQILKSKQKNCLICLPIAIKSRKHLTRKASNFWRNYLCNREIKLLNLLHKNIIFGDTNFTRPYMDYSNKETSKIIFENIRNLFKDQDLLIVEGEHTRSGIGNDLFAKAHSIQRILCPSKDAWDKYDEILNEVKVYGKGKLILICLGPTATVLAYDLSANPNNDYWAIDLGHLDVEYEWYLTHTIEKIQIPGKVTVEATGNAQYKLSHEEKSIYTQQIISTIF